ncbi:MAG: hypothetical protein AB7I27_05135 [Bacteriovoracaceae bacterium]
MEKLILLLEDFILKAIVQTETAINTHLLEENKIESFVANRERLFAIIEQISSQISWDLVSLDKKNELNRQLTYLKKLDDDLLIKLTIYQQEIRKDIEKTFRQKENIKGYNLNDVK